MAQIPGENRKVANACRRRDGEVSKTGGLTRRTRPVHQQPGNTCRGNIERQHPGTVEVKNYIKPMVEAVGTYKAA